MKSEQPTTDRGPMSVPRLFDVIARWNWLITLIFSGALSYGIVNLTIDQQKRSNFGQGSALADMVGYRYFHVYEGTTVLKPIDGTDYRVFATEELKRNYLGVLEEIKEQIQEMSAIPEFVYSYDNIAELSNLQNFIVNETTVLRSLRLEKSGPFENTVSSMCKIYVRDNGLWSDESADPVGEAQEIRDLAREICKQIPVH